VVILHSLCHFGVLRVLKYAGNEIAQRDLSRSRKLLQPGKAILGENFAQEQLAALDGLLLSGRLAMPEYTLSKLEQLPMTYRALF